MASDSMQNSMRHYKNMRDSGVEWIGMVPSDWKPSTIGSVYQARNTKVSDTDYPPLSVTMNGVVPQLATAAKTDAHDARKLVKSGDFVINSRSDRRGSCGISSYTGSVSLINTVLEPREQMNAQYYNWLFHTVQFADEFYKNGHGIVDDLWTTGWQEMKRIIIPMPSLDMQEEIAAFLNEKCAQIDSTISQAKTSIEEYKAWKSSIIYEAITKGLDSNVEMKDSGIAWIEQIPAGLKISRVGLQYDIILGKMLCPVARNKSDTLERYYCAANVHFEGLSDTDLKQMWFNPDEKKQYLVRQGDLLVVEGGAGAGGCCICESTPVEPIYIQNSVMIVRPKRPVDNHYLKYLIESLVTRGYIDFICNKATIPHFTKEKLCSVPFPMFSLQEQQRIARYLNKICRQINTIISEKGALIAELEAYKKSLIFEAVTGKRKVV